jgi:hypothetical protein
MNPRVTFGISFVDDFWVNSGLVFISSLYVNRCCERWRIHASHVEAVWLMISKSVVDQFSLTLSESTAVSVLTNTRITCGSGFVDDFWVGISLVFVDYFWIKRGCVLSRIQASPVESFRWRLLSQHRLRFHWLCLSQQRWVCWRILA